MTRGQLIAFAREFAKAYSEEPAVADVLVTCANEIEALESEAEALRAQLEDARAVNESQNALCSLVTAYHACKPRASKDPAPLIQVAFDMENNESLPMRVRNVASAVLSHVDNKRFGAIEALVNAIEIMAEGQEGVGA